MTPEQRIDEALELVLKAAGSAELKYHIMSSNMREVMRKIMSDAYIAGSDDAFKAMSRACELIDEETDRRM